ncbi:hypothetical protein KW785_00060 [Candidatus Parcubacteria bacterium]|nr:hypothetical protein [Candidatus Parcubacteria bacterium]
MIEFIRVRRVDGQDLVCECRNSKPNEGTIGTENGWQDFLKSLPRPNGKKGKPAAEVAATHDLEFADPVDAAILRGYTLAEVLKRFEDEQTRPPINFATLWTEELKKKDQKALADSH